MAGQRNDYRKRSNSSDRNEKRQSKRRPPGDDRDQFVIDRDDTVYRYLCPASKIGTIIGRGGEIAKQLRSETRSKIRIGDTVHGCDDRVITIYSPSDDTNRFGSTDDLVCPAQDALFRVHDRVVADTFNDDDGLNGSVTVTARLLVPSDQIGSVIGKGGQIIQNIRSESGAHIRIIKDDRLPSCSLSTDELVQISGEPSLVKKALFQIASRLHESPSRSQHLLASTPPVGHQSGSQFMGPASVAPIMGLAPLVGGYGPDGLDWPRPIYPSRNDSPSKEFSIRMVSLVKNIGGVIGKNGAIINQIRQESGASIRVDSSAAEGEDCLISISAEEVFGDGFSPVVEAAVRLQPRCSDKIERDSGIISFTTRLLVPKSRIGCLIGKGGSIVTELRRITKANIRILSKESLPKVASEDDELVQISGDLDVSKCALVYIMTRLRSNVFDRETPGLVPLIHYLPMSGPMDGLREDRDGRRRGGDRAAPYSDGYGGSDPGDGYGNYGAVPISSYALGGEHASGHGGGSRSGLSRQGSVSKRRSYAGSGGAY